jgi:hypothetical protein
VACLSATQSGDVREQIQRSNDLALTVSQRMGVSFPNGACAVWPLNHDCMAVIGLAVQQSKRHPALFVAYSRTIR